MRKQGFDRLKSFDYAIVNSKGIKLVASTFVLRALRVRCVSTEQNLIPEVGFIASKKVGGAVYRNRCRRIFRAAFTDLAKNLDLFKKLNPVGIEVGSKIKLKVVLIARKELVTCKAQYCEVYNDLSKFLGRLTNNKLDEAEASRKKHSTYEEHSVFRFRERLVSKKWSVPKKI